jgi:hypothetical protein
MDTVCVRCRELAHAAGQDPVPLGVWSWCWCRSDEDVLARARRDGIDEPADLFDIESLSAAVRERPADERDVDELVSLGGGFDWPMIAPLVAERPSPWSRYRRVAAAVLGAAVVAGALALWAGASQPASLDVRGPTPPSLVAAPAAAIATRPPAPPVAVATAAVAGAPAAAEEAETRARRAVDVEAPRAAPASPRPSVRPAAQRAAPPRAGLASTVAPEDPETPAQAAEAVEAPVASLEVSPTPPTPAAEAPVEEPSRPQVDLLELTGGASAATDGDPSSHQPPTRAQLVEALRAVAPLVLNCGSGAEAAVSREVRVDATFGGETGRVSRVTVVGPLAGTAEGACVERAVRRARVPTFGGDEVDVASYPFRIR